MSFSTIRISGLEDEPAVIVLTNHSVHVFSNFESIDKTLNGMRLKSIAGIEISDSRVLLGKILHEVVRTDVSYKCIEFKDVRSIFKRRHQLKKTALEITDRSGYSFLFSCKDERVYIIYHFFLKLYIFTYIIIFSPYYSFPCRKWKLLFEFSWILPCPRTSCTELKGSQTSRWV